MRSNRTVVGVLFWARVLIFARRPLDRCSLLCSMSGCFFALSTRSRFSLLLDCLRCHMCRTLLLGLDGSMPCCSLAGRVVCLCSIPCSDPAWDISSFPYLFCSSSGKSIMLLVLHGLHFGSKRLVPEPPHISGKGAGPGERLPPWTRGCYIISCAKAAACRLGVIPGNDSRLHYFDVLPLSATCAFSFGP